MMTTENTETVKREIRKYFDDVSIKGNFINGSGVTCNVKTINTNQLSLIDHLGTRFALQTFIKRSGTGLSINFSQNLNSPDK